MNDSQTLIPRQPPEERREAGDMNAVSHDHWRHVPLTRQARYIWQQFYPRTRWREGVHKIIRDLIAGRMNARNARGGGHRCKKRLQMIIASNKRNLDAK